MHRATALLMGACIAHGAILYYGPLSLAVGHRRVVELVHVYAGFALPAPMLLGLASAAYRADLRRLNRFTSEDWRWLRSQDRRDGTFQVGKFNAGQKLNAALVAGSIVVLVGTGTLMFFPGWRGWPGGPERPSCTTGSRSGWDCWCSGTCGSRSATPRRARACEAAGCRRSWARKEHRAWLAEQDRS